MTKIAPFRVTYDVEGDLLYLNRGDEAAVRGVEAESGIVWRYNGAGVLIGTTIMDFLETWLHRQSALTDEIASHFDAPSREIATSISTAIGGQRRILRAGQR
jgi:hypothetical protein